MRRPSRTIRTDGQLSSCGCQQHFRRLPVQSHRTVLNAMRYDDELSGLDSLFTVTKFHEQASPVNKEQLIVVLSE